MALLKTRKEKAKMTPVEVKPDGTGLYLSPCKFCEKALEVMVLDPVSLKIGGRVCHWECWIAYVVGNGQR